MTPTKADGLDALKEDTREYVYKRNPNCALPEVISDVVFDTIDYLAQRGMLQAWLPIESAPHEELVVLGWWETWPGPTVFKQTIGLASAGERFPNGASNRWQHGSATYWMPLPAAPKMDAIEIERQRDKECLERALQCDDTLRTTFDAPKMEVME